MTATITGTMTPLVASSAVRLPVGRRRRRAGWPVVISVLLHLALLALAIVAARHKRSVPEPVPPASMAMVFEGGGNAPPSIANPAPVAPNQPASPAPQPSVPLPPLPTPPVEQPPQPPTAPPVATPPPPEVVPQPKEAVPPPPEVVPPPKEAVPPSPEVVPPPKEAVPAQEVVPPAQEEAPPPPPAPAPKVTPQPAPEISAPLSTAPAVQAPALEPVPSPPPLPVPAPEAPPQPVPPRPPRPREAARPPRPREEEQPVSPPHPSPAFPAPMEFSLGPRVATPEATPPRPRASPGTIDMSFAPMMGGGDITQLHPQGKGDDVGDDWFNQVAAWWLRHRYYPSEAARLQQQGDVMLRLVVGRDGRVEAVEVEQRSGSPWLDMGALAIFRDAKLPPLPPDVRDPNVTVNFNIHYLIIR